MELRDKVINLVYKAIDNINEQKLSEHAIEKNIDTVLYADSGYLDSLGIMTLIVATEQLIQGEFGTVVTLANERAMSMTDSPFKTVDSLVKHIEAALAEAEELKR